MAAPMQIAFRREEATGVRRVMPLGLVLVCLLAAEVATSRQSDWQPLSLVVALGSAMIVADVMSVSARGVRISVGLTIQVASMALLGPAPAAAIGVAAALADGLINPVRPRAMLVNMAIFGILPPMRLAIVLGLVVLTGCAREDGQKLARVGRLTAEKVRDVAPARRREFGQRRRSHSRQDGRRRCSYS